MSLFPFGMPVPKEEIIDREDFLMSVKNRLLMGQNLVLAGPRRIGKTSLALELLRQLKDEGYYTVFVDMFRLSGKNMFSKVLVDACLGNRTKITNTLEQVKQNFLHSSKLSLKLKGLELSLTRSNKTVSDDELFDYALNLTEKLAQADKKKLIVVFDEFQEIERIAGENSLKVIRAHIQLHTHVNYLFMGSQTSMMKTIFSNQNQAFYRFAISLPVPPIPPEAMAQYITKKFTEQDIEILPEAIRMILDITGGHPQDTMLVCSESYQALVDDKRKTLNIEHVFLGRDRAFAFLSQGFNEIIESIDPVAKTLLLRIARAESLYSKGNHPNTIKRTLDQLMDKGIIQKIERGKYDFVEPMFKGYFSL
ncbi:archaeal ATPase [Peptococcaceae bacterium CEB3]|nr:archaeal ATPase [Peptococcaceae bacterium CEB3]